MSANREAATSEAAEIFLKKVPPRQLNMGTPFYGYFYTNINQLFGLCPNSLYTADGDCDNTSLDGELRAIHEESYQPGWVGDVL